MNNALLVVCGGGGGVAVRPAASIFGTFAMPDIRRSFV